VGTLLLIFFTTREYGMDFFAGPGLGQVPAGAAWWQKIWLASPHLLLPVLCIAYPALAFIARQMRGSMAAALQQDFVRTARAKGLPEKTVVWRHAFRNALFPVITLIASVFPAAIAGSVAIEYIFNIPGMGWLMLNAILQKDWSIVFTVLMLGAVLTMAGMLVADVLYAAADPRVRFSKQSKVI
jgi:peptide/nickel transport system permease protein